MKNKQNQTGFSLIEVAIILIISGLILGGLFQTKKIIDSQKMANKYYTSVTLIGASLNQYVRFNGAYPAPASYTISPTNTDYGKPVDT